MTKILTVDGLRDMTPDEENARAIEEEKAQAFIVEQTAEQVRLNRNVLLQETDYLILKAYEYQTVVPQSWKDYRKQLRDIPDQAGFPLNVVWPEKPE